MIYLIIGCVEDAVRPRGSEIEEIERIVGIQINSVRDAVTIAVWSAHFDDPAERRSGAIGVPRSIAAHGHVVAIAGIIGDKS